MAHYDPADYWDEEDDDSLYSYRAYREGRAACPAGVRSPDFDEVYQSDEFGNEEFVGSGRQCTR